MPVIFAKDEKDGIEGSEEKQDYKGEVSYSSTKFFI